MINGFSLCLQNTRPQLAVKLPSIPGPLGMLQSAHSMSLTFLSGPVLLPCGIWPPVKPPENEDTSLLLLPRFLLSRGASATELQTLCAPAAKLLCAPVKVEGCPPLAPVYWAGHSVQLVVLGLSRVSENSSASVSSSVLHNTDLSYWSGVC